MTDTKMPLHSHFPFFQVLCYNVPMTIEQTVEIPTDYRVFLELPHSIPSGVKAKVKISIPAAVVKSQSDSVSLPSAAIEDVNRLLQKEMAEIGNNLYGLVFVFEIKIFITGK